MNNEEYLKAIKAMSFDDYWGKVEASGWLNWIPKTEILEMKKKVGNEFNERPQYAYTFLSRYIIVHDSGPEEMTPYIEDLSRVSNGQFNPTNIIESDEHGEQILKFEFNHKVYSIDTIPFDDNWHGTHKWEVELINHALEDNKNECRFIQLPYCDEEVPYIFIPPRIYKKAQELGVIPPDDEYFTYLMENDET
jgi:hypothetical protein